MTYDIQLSSDGLPGKYGNEFNLDIDEAAAALLYYDEFSKRYSEETMIKFLKEMKLGYVMKGSRWSEFKITKNK